jgi:RimJ/RimL family protein N-acetyltransferase
MFPAGWRQAPPEIRTDRLHLRCPREEDGPQLFAAITESQAQLRPWFAWAADLNLTPDNCKFTAAYARERFLSGREMQFYIFAQGQKKLLGICGLLRPDWAKRSFEICYWLRTSFAGHGYMSEAVSAVTQFALQELAAKRIEARCDVANKKGLAVAKRAGYVLEEKVVSDTPHHIRRVPTEIAVLVRLAG